MLFVCVVFGVTGHAQNLTAVQDALYYEYYQKANQLAAEQVLKDTEIGKSLFWQSFVALETGDSALLKLNIQRANSVKSNGGKEDVYLRLVPIFFYLFSNQTSTAKKIADSVLKSSEYKDHDLMLAISSALTTHDHHEAKYVLTLLEKIPVKKRNTPYYYQIKGDAHRRLIQGTEAVQAYQKAIAIQPSFAKAYVSIARIYQTQQNHEVAIQFLEKAIDKDSLYGPAYFELFYSSYYANPKKAEQYLEKYVSMSEMSLSQLYMQMDFYFVGLQYQKSIEVADQILSRQNLSILPRVHKLKAYAYAALKDSATAKLNMESYFQLQQPTSLVAKDYRFYAKLLLSQNADVALVAGNLHHSLQFANARIDSLNTYHSLKQLAVGNQEKDSIIYFAEKVFSLNAQYLNAIDLYHWGMAHYQKEEYEKSAFVFKQYTLKYPNEVYGWLWKARALSNLLDKMYDTETLEAYQKVISNGARQLDRFQNVIIQSHGYLGAYYANQEKDYQTALSHFKAILKIDPQHYDAMQYVELLEEWAQAN